MQINPSSWLIWLKILMQLPICSGEWAWMPLAMDFHAVCPSIPTITTLSSWSDSNRQQNQMMKMDDAKQHVGPLNAQI